MSRIFKLANTSTVKINKCLDNLSKYIEADLFDDFSEQFQSIIIKDVKMIKDCSEKSIVDFYINSVNKLIFDEELEINDSFYDRLKDITRHKLADKYVSKQIFDNTIDIYFNEVKREYILHPQGESEELAFIPENRDIFIKNNLKLVIECAKRYQNLGLPLEDLIQAGNIGLLTAFNKFDSQRANLKISILNDIKHNKKNNFTYDEACDIIKRNFQYTKLLDATLKKIPQNGFESKDDFIKWTNTNIKKASFSSIGFMWIRAIIIDELNKTAKTIHTPNDTKKKKKYPINIIRLDSLNPHTDDCYHDNQISEIAQEEFIIEDESIERIEKNNMFKDLVSKLLNKLQPLERRLIKKRFGIDTPFEMTINEIAENEGMAPNKVKYAIMNALKVIQNNIPDADKETILEMIR